MIELAEQLATALRVFKGDAALALWLFDDAGGSAAAQAFIDQAQLAQVAPDDLQVRARLADIAPTAARLLEAAVLLVKLVSSLDPRGGTDNEAKANAANLEPIARP